MIRTPLGGRTPIDSLSHKSSLSISRKDFKQKEEVIESIKKAKEELESLKIEGKGLEDEIGAIRGKRASLATK